MLGAELHGVEQACQLGLIDEIAEHASSRAGEQLARLASHPRDTYAATKLALRREEIEPTASEREAFRKHDLAVWTSPETKQRVRAVLRR